MAIYNGRILMRKGNEADFDAEKLMSGEWAVSLDKGIVRICLEAGKVIRMATYEAFEEDMKRVEEILLECQTVEEAVIRINTEVSAKANAVVELVEQAKTYRDEAEQFRNEAESFKNQAGEIVGIDIATNERAGISKPDGETLEIDPDGTLRVIGGGGVSDYEEIENKPSINNVELSGNKTLEELGIASKEELDKTVFKVDTIIEKADLGIKETAIGEEIHLTDSADGKAVEYALYGKATQDGTPSPENPVDIVVAGESYNFLNNTAQSNTVNNVTFIVNEDKSITINSSNCTHDSYLATEFIELKAGNYIFTNGFLTKPDFGNAYLADENGTALVVDSGGGAEFNLSKKSKIKFVIWVKLNAVINNFTLYPMIRKESVTNDRYMPYGVGSVEVKSVGKNFLKNTATTQTINGVTFTVNDDKSIKVSGTANAYTRYIINSFKLKKGKYFLTGSIENNKRIFINVGDTYYDDYGNGRAFSLEEDANVNFAIVIMANEVCNGEIFKPMIRICDEQGNPIDDATYEPYKENLSAIPTTNGIAGIKVDSGGNYTDTNGQQWICDEVVKYADGSGEHIQRIEKKIFDGVTNKCSWVSSSLNNETLRQINLDYRVMSDGVFIRSDYILCDKFKPFIFNSANDNFAYGCRQGGDNAICCLLKESDGITDVTKANAWLQENNVTVYYILKEPITTPLTAEQLADIETFYPVTNITNNFDCGMKVKYKCDGKNYIDKRLALIEQALINNI